jgi:hypothetical protein
MEERSSRNAYLLSPDGLVADEDPRQRGGVAQAAGRHRPWSSKGRLQIVRTQPRSSSSNQSHLGDKVLAASQ